MKRLLLTLCAAACLWAAPFLTQISDTVYNADGSLFTGTVLIRPPSAAALTSNGSPISLRTVSVNVTAGVLSTELSPTDSMLPGGASYIVTFKATTGAQWVESWVVPTSSTAVNLQTIRTAVLTNPLPVILAEQIAPGTPTYVLTTDGTRVFFGPAGQAPVTNTAILAALGYTPASLDSGGYVPATNIPALTGDVIKNAGSNATTVQAIRNYSVTTAAPSDGQLMRWSASAGQWIYITRVSGEVPSGTMDGTNLVFTLANTPLDGLVITLNGLVLSVGNDYTVSGNTITFVVNANPQPGDILKASYQH